VIIILECLLILLAKSTIIPTNPEIIIATTIAIPARFTTIIRILTSTTIAM